jgi:hypothetical protein
MAPLISTPIQDALENEQDIAADLEGSGTIDHVHHHHAHHDSGKHDVIRTTAPCVTIWPA